MPDSDSPSPLANLVDLLQCAQRGQRSAEEQFLTFVYTPILRYVYRFVRSVPDPSDAAQDLAQEVLIHICQKLPSCRAASEEQVLAWVLTLARNHAIDRSRSLQAATFVRLNSAFELLWASPACEPAQRDQTLTAVRRIVRQEFSRLPKQTQDIFALHRVSNASWPSIAVELGISASAAKRRYQRAQKSLAGRLLRRVSELPEQLRPSFLAHLL